MVTKIHLRSQIRYFGHTTSRKEFLSITWSELNMDFRNLFILELFCNVRKKLLRISMIKFYFRFLSDLVVDDEWMMMNDEAPERYGTLALRTNFYITNLRNGVRSEWSWWWSRMITSMMMTMRPNFVNFAVTSSSESFWQIFCISHEVKSGRCSAFSQNFSHLQKF